MATPGYQSPPSVLAKRKREDPNEENEQSSPSVVTNSRKGTSQPTKEPRPIGPTLPPANVAEIPHELPEVASSSSEDDFGPSIPKGPQEPPAVSSVSTRPELQASVERDSWMMIPPSQSDWSTRVDPTKLRNRKFNTGRGVKGPSRAGEGGIDTKWTETPAEKRARLEREMMGIQEVRHTAEHSHNKSRERQTAKKVREFAEKSRGPTLYSEHQKGNPQDKEDDPGARAFDREKDIVSGTKISHTKRREMMQKASDFGSRFSSGTFL